jgi:hypothetical protein
MNRVDQRLLTIYPSELKFSHNDTTENTMYDFCITLDGEEYIVYVNSFTPEDQGRTWGRPEDCYPPAGPEADFDLICEMTGTHADERVVCKHYDRIISEIEEQAAGIADDYVGA